MRSDTTYMVGKSTRAGTTTLREEHFVTDLNSPLLSASGVEVFVLRYYVEAKISCHEYSEIYEFRLPMMRKNDACISYHIGQQLVEIVRWFGSSESFASLIHNLQLNRNLPIL